MQRLLISVLAAALLLAAAVAVPAVGFELTGYAGQIKHDPETDVGFDLNRTEGGTRKVSGFIGYNITFTCEVGTPGRTDALKIKGKFPADSEGKFHGTGEAVGIPSDPTGKLKGELRPHHKAVGSVRLFGELDGSMGSNCDTGWQEWKAEKTSP